MSAWQPIETAPKDGTEVLLLIPVYKRPVCIGSYEISEHFSHGRSTYRREYWSTGRLRYFSGDRDDSDQPTHWMPLPEPPATEAAA